MEAGRTPKQQFVELIRSSASLLVVTHADADGDAAGSALALASGLRKLGKQVAVHAGGRLAGTFDFLPGYAGLADRPAVAKDLLIILDEAQAEAGDVQLKRLSETKLAIVVTPRGGTLSPENVRIEEGTYGYDAVVVLDCANLDRIGALAEERADLFYEVPVVNVDHHPGNVNFGKVNLVDVTASSTAEMLVSLLESLGQGEPLIDEDVATCLLTGIITDTGSFQNGNTTPKSLTIAAQLVGAGARQQEIVRRVFKQRTLSQLRLWGRALAYIKEEAQAKFAWSVLIKADFVAAQAEPEERAGVLDELLKTAEGMDFVMLLTEEDGGLKVSMRSISPSFDVEKLARHFGGGGHVQAAAFFLPNVSPTEGEQRVVSELRKQLGPPAGALTMPVDA